MAWKELAILVSITLADGQYDCMQRDGDACNGTVWVLSVEGSDVAELDTEEECREMADELTDQLPQWHAAQCRKEPVARTKM